jgi:hypothetical protein
MLTQKEFEIVKKSLELLGNRSNNSISVTEAISLLSEFIEEPKKVPSGPVHRSM